MFSHISFCVNCDTGGTFMGFIMNDAFMLI